MPSACGDLLNMSAKQRGAWEPSAREASAEASDADDATGVAVVLALEGLDMQVLEEGGEQEQLFLESVKRCAAKAVAALVRGEVVEVEPEDARAQMAPHARRAASLFLACVCRSALWRCGLGFDGG